MKNKEKLYENIATFFMMLGGACALVLLLCGAIIPLINNLIYFIENTTFNIQELVAFITGIGGVIFIIVAAIFAFLCNHETEKRLEHEFRMQFEKKEK